MKRRIGWAVLAVLFLMLCGCGASRTGQTAGTVAPASETLVEYEIPMESIEADIIIILVSHNICQIMSKFWIWNCIRLCFHGIM